MTNKTEQNINTTYYKKILNLSIEKLDILSEDKYTKEIIILALNKTLDKIKEGKLSPAIFPIVIEKDLKLNKTDLAVELAVICAYFHTAADLADDVEDNSLNNDVINKYGKSQAINISNKLIFIYQQLILKLNIEQKNKIELLSLFAKSASKMTTGQFYDLAMTNKVNFPYDNKKININDIESISKNKAGIELGCFISCILTALGKASELYYDLGVLYGTLVQIFSDYFDIWGKPLSEDLVDLKNSFPLFSTYNDSSLSEKVRLLISGKNDSFDKQIDFKRLLAQTEVIENFSELLVKYTESINEIKSLLPPLSEFSEMLNELIDNSTCFVETLQTIRHEYIRQPFTDNFDLNKTIDNALTYLKTDNSLRDTWEIQRWGFLGETVLLGNIFTPALVLETLLEFDFDISEYLEYFINLKGNKGWCYYSNTDKLPTDSDVLGQLLNLVSRTKKFEKYNEYFSEPLEILKRNIEKNGKCPTWLDDGFIHFKNEIEKKWYGNECLGVMANLYYGLYLTDKNSYHEVINKGIDFIISNLPSEKTEMGKGSYYTFYYMFYVVSRLVNAMGLEFTKLNQVRDKIVRQQNLNGSWNNSSQDTAFILLGLMSFPQQNNISLKTAAKYLSETQNYDGSWDREELFVCPGKNDRLVYYKNDKVTTSFCLRALFYVNKFIVIAQENCTKKILMLGS